MDAPAGARSSRVPRPRARLGGRRGTPYLAAHAYLLGSFTEFHRLGSFQRLTLCWRIFGRDRVTGEIARLRAVLARWGYQAGRDDDSLLPLVASQLFLFNRSPHLEDLSTDLLNRFRTERLIEGARLNTDMLETNPPFSIWLYMPFMLLEKLVGGRAELWLTLGVICLSLASLFMSARILAYADPVYRR